MVDGSVMLPDNSPYGPKEVLSELARSRPGLLQKQPRGVVQLIGSVTVSPTRCDVEVTIQSAAHLISPCSVMKVIVLVDGRMIHTKTYRLKSKSCHPKLSQTCAWQLTADQHASARIQIDFIGTKKSAQLGTLSFATHEILDTAGWFYLYSRTIGVRELLRATPPKAARQQLELARPESKSRLRLVMPPTSLLDVKLIQKLGRGSFGQVILGVDAMGREFAIKGVSKAQMNGDDDAIAGLLIEKAIMCSYRHHSLVHLFATFQTDKFVYFVMEALRGGDLHTIVLNGKSLSLTITMFYTAEILLGLWYLHDEGVLFRDLKLENVLLDSRGHARLTDFGLAKDLGETGRTTNTMCGTPEYLAPEMIQGFAYGVSVDFWSLGVLVYRMLVGRFPFSAATSGTETGNDALFQAIIQEDVQIPSTVKGSAAVLISGLLNRNPEARLGCDSQRGAEEIRALAAFQCIDWNRHAAMQTKAPLKPNTPPKGVDTIEQGEAAFSTPRSDDITIDQKPYEGFSWTQEYELNAKIGLR